MPLTSKVRLYTNYRENDDAPVRILQHGHHEAHKLLCPAKGIIDEKLVVKLKLTEEMLAKAEAPLTKDELDKLRNRSVKTGELSKR